jgi:hypothetical protein
MEGFFVLESIGDQTEQQINDGVGKTAMAGVLDLGNVLELITDGLNDGSLAQHELIFQEHQTVLHILAEGCTLTWLSPG